METTEPVLPSNTSENVLNVDSEPETTPKPTTRPQTSRGRPQNNPNLSKSNISSNEDEIEPSIHSLINGKSELQSASVTRPKSAAPSSASNNRPVPEKNSYPTARPRTAPRLARGVNLSMDTSVPLPATLTHSLHPPPPSPAIYKMKISAANAAAIASSRDKTPAQAYHNEVALRSKYLLSSLASTKKASSRPSSGKPIKGSASAYLKSKDSNAAGIEQTRWKISRPSASPSQGNPAPSSQHPGHASTQLISNPAGAKLTAALKDSGASSAAAHLIALAVMGGPTATPTASNSTGSPDPILPRSLTYHTHPHSSAHPIGAHTAGFYSKSHYNAIRNASRGSDISALFKSTDSVSSVSSNNGGNKVHKRASTEESPKKQAWEFANNNNSTANPGGRKVSFAQKTAQSVIVDGTELNNSSVVSTNAIADMKRKMSLDKYGKGATTASVQGAKPSGTGNMHQQPEPSSKPIKRPSSAAAEKSANRPPSAGSKMGFNSSVITIIDQLLVKLTDLECPVNILQDTLDKLIAIAIENGGQYQE
jgi:hypothetical protein